MLDFCTLPTRGLKAHRSRSVDRSNVTSSSQDGSGFATVRRGRQQVRARCTSVERYADYDVTREPRSRASASADAGARIDVGAAGGLQEAIASFEATLKQSRRDVTAASRVHLPPPRLTSSRCAAAPVCSQNSSNDVNNDVIDSFLNGKRESFAYKSLPRISARPLRVTSQPANPVHSKHSVPPPCAAGAARNTNAKNYSPLSLPSQNHTPPTHPKNYTPLSLTSQPVSTSSSKIAANQ